MKYELSAEQVFELEWNYYGCTLILLELGKKLGSSNLGWNMRLELGSDFGVKDETNFSRKFGLLERGERGLEETVKIQLGKNVKFSRNNLNEI